jgi:hypothetical protein
MEERNPVGYELSKPKLEYCEFILEELRIHKLITWINYLSKFM